MEDVVERRSAGWLRNRSGSRHDSNSTGRAQSSSVRPFRPCRNRTVTPLLLSLAASIRRVSGAAILLCRHTAGHRGNGYLRRAIRPDGRHQPERQHERCREGIPTHHKQPTQLSPPGQFFRTNRGVFGQLHGFRWRLLSRQSETIFASARSWRYRSQGASHLAIPLGSVADDRRLSTI